MSSLFDLYASNDEELVEIIDDNEQPFMVMSLNDACKQGLCHNIVITLLHSPEGKVYLPRHSRHNSNWPERWDASAFTHVRANESRKGAACRSLYEELGVKCTHCTRKVTKHSQQKFYMPELFPTAPKFGNVNVSIFHATAPSIIPAPDHRGIDNLVCLAKSELTLLLREYESQLTPALKLVGELDLAFP